jgi:hypothetical protein
MVYGDWINATDDYTVISDVSEFISVVKGHCVFLFIKKDTVQIATSYFSFLPVYYTTDGKFVSNNWEESAKKSDCQLDEMFVIESHLFNYPLIYVIGFLLSLIATLDLVCCLNNLSLHVALTLLPRRS